jgi:hypothetical protein
MLGPLLCLHMQHAFGLILVYLELVNLLLLLLKVFLALLFILLRPDHGLLLIFPLLLVLLRLH